MTTSAAGESAPSAGAGKAGGARNLGEWLTWWWFQAPGGGTYQRRRADALVAAAGLGVLVVGGVLVANRLALGTDVAVFRRINHWPGWLYPPMWTVQLPGMIGAFRWWPPRPRSSGGCAWPRPWRLLTVLKVSLEAAAKIVVQRDRPAETLPDVILRGKAAAHGLSFPSGYAMAIFAIATLAAPTSKAGGRPCRGPWPPRSACRVCISARTSRWTSLRERAWACSSGAC
jgi:hypothetical protein